VRLELHIDERQGHIAGVATLSWTALHADLASVHWDLASCMHVQEVHIGKRRVRWEHLNEQLHIYLPRAASLGQQIEITVVYEGHPTRGLWFTAPDKAHPKRPTTVWSQGQDEDARFWFPCWDSPNDKFTSEVLVTVRQPFIVVANGRLQGVTDNKRRRLRTFHWKEDFPHPAYLLSIVVGEFFQHTETVDGVELQYYVHPSDKKSLPLLFDRTPEMLRFFTRVIDYPYPY
jgi:aminopeptidase N